MQGWILVLWITICINHCTIQCTHEMRGILGLTNASLNYFETLWNSNSYNDPNNNKSQEFDFDTLYGDGDFKAAIDTAWGNPVEMVLQMYNGIGDVLAHISFNASNSNITSLSNWVTGSKYRNHWPHANPTSFTPTIRNGVKEMVMKSSSSDEALFAIVHDSSWTTAMLLAVNSSIALNSSTGGDLDNIQLPVSIPLVNVYRASWTNSVVITEGDWSWSDGFLYINGISVYGTDGGSGFVSYSINYTNYYDNSESYYSEQFTSNGVTEWLHTLLIDNLTITFGALVENVTLSLFGPSDGSFVAVSMLYVYGLFDTSTTSTSTTSTTSTTTPTTSVPTTAPANLSIVINGTLYCPCAQQQNNSTNTTVDLDQVVAEIVANLTLDKDSLSSNTRRYTSAEDSRSSAKTVGAFGVIFIVASISLVVYVDSATLLKELTRIPKNYKHFKTRIPRKSVKVDDISTQIVENNVVYAEGALPKPRYGRSVTLPDIVM